VASNPDDAGPIAKWIQFRRIPCDIVVAVNPDATTGGLLNPAIFKLRNFPDLGSPYVEPMRFPQC
jgi:hypothetical protein